MRINHNQMVIAAFVSCLFIAPNVWMLLDRDPPYIRDYGEIRPTEPGNCGIEQNDGSEKEINPGDCVTANWHIIVKRNCVPNVTNNVTRRIQDSEKVIHTIAPIAGVFGTTTKPPQDLIRYFQVPSGAAAGRALYKSTACFACNPLQNLIWPICVSHPDLEFEISPSSTRFAPRARIPH